MQRECQLMDNGDVYEIQRDGTIHKVGNIKSRPAPIYSRSAEKLKKWRWAVSIVGGLAIIGLIIPLAIVSDNLDYARRQWRHYKELYNDGQNIVNQAQDELETYKTRYNNEKEVADQAKREMNSFKDKVGKVYPMIISKIEMGNGYSDGTMETSYGSTIYSSYTMYLKPKIYYTGISTGSHTLKVKLFTPDGSISKGDSSPSGFSYSGSYYVYSGEDTMVLSGWGSSTKGHWRSGSYRIEIWYEDVCLKTKTFMIY